MTQSLETLHHTHTIKIINLKNPKEKMGVIFEDIKKIPNKSGIYSLLCDDTIVYIGRSRNCYQRILEHYAQNSKEFDSIGFYASNGAELFFDILEVIIISKLKPKYNKLVMDDIWTFLKCLPYESIKDEYQFFSDHNKLIDSANTLSCSLARREIL